MEISKDRWWFQICFIFKFDTYCILQLGWFNHGSLGRTVVLDCLCSVPCPRLPLFGPLVVGSDARASEVLFRFLDWLFAIFPFSFMRFAVRCFRDLRIPFVNLFVFFGYMARRQLACSDQSHLRTETDV